MHDPNEDPKKPASHRTAAFILIAVFVGIAFLGWQVFRTSRMSITAVTKPADYVLTASRKPPTSFWIRISGWIDGQAVVEIPTRPPLTLGPGNVREKISGDWYAPECVLKYTPKSTTMGRLEIEYRIE